MAEVPSQLDLFENLNCKPENEDITSFKKNN